jgi:hypothetical protein
VIELKAKLWVTSSLVLLTPAVLLVHGYHPLADDGAVYVTGIKKLANPGLYQSDAVFALSPTRLSVFAHVLAPLLRWVPLPGVLLVCQLASIFLFLLGSWRVASRLFSTRRACWGAVLLAACCFTLPVAGTSLSIMDPYVTARSFSTPLGLFALAAVLEEDWVWAVFWVAWAGVLHPLMAAYCALSALTVALTRRRLWRSLGVFYGLGFLFCAVIFFAGHTAASICPQNPGLKSETWATHLGFLGTKSALLLEVRGESGGISAVGGGDGSQKRVSSELALSRAALSRSYFFLSSWRWYEYPGLLIPLLLLGAAGTNKQAPRHARALAYAATLMGSYALLVSLCFVHRSGSLLLARLQVLRGFQFVYIAGVLLAGGLLAKLRTRTIAAICLLLAGALFAGQWLTYPESNHVEWPGLTPRNRWQQAFLWIRSGTPDNAIFALDNDYIESPGEDAQGFRASAERSAVADWYKDGGIASNFPQAAIPWWQGSDATEHLNIATDEQRLARLKPFGVTWIVLPAEASTGFPCPFINVRVRVCRVAVSHVDGAK